MKKERIYISIDLKSFYASVECVERGIDPLDAYLVVADLSRTEKTICLAVSPALKKYGVSGRARLFEVVEKVREINGVRLSRAPRGKFTDKGYFLSETEKNPSLEVDYIVAVPRMALYMKTSAEIFKIYLKYVCAEDIHVYSVDEVFMDVTDYLYAYDLTARQLADKIIKDILNTTGITATAGIGTNLYLCKVAMDIVAKHLPAENGESRIAELDEISYRRLLWEHKPITDFWRIGRGYSRTLARFGMFTMGDVAMCSLVSEELLYQLFGVNAELLIDHAWGYESCSIDDIKSYKPRAKSLSSGQVLKEPHTFKKAKLIVREMTELLVLNLVEQGLLTDQIVLTIGYDISNLTAENSNYKGEIKVDFYGRKAPKQAHGSENLGRFTSSTKLIVDAAMKLFDRIADEDLLVRRMYVVANHTVEEAAYKRSEHSEQLDLFTDYEAYNARKEKEERFLKRERSIQETAIQLHKRFGKNSLLKGMNLKEGATSIERNEQIGGHRA